ncbi:S8 family serine peptidase [candidate division WOR-3 bacterium]|nr:S8 family serine peptidase [candidate division WOR-3 bacterium]
MKMMRVFLAIALFASVLSAEMLHKDGEVIVKFRTDLRNSVSFESDNTFLRSGYASLDAVFTEHQVQSFRQLIPDYDNTKNIDYGLDMIYVFVCSSDQMAMSSVNAFRSCAEVEFAEPNYRMEAFTNKHSTGWEPFLTPNDPYYTYQWFLPKISASAAWDIQTGSHGKIVAIVDDAVEMGHEDLSPNYMTGYDYADMDSDPTPPNTSESHGTHCSGCAAAKGNNGTGVASIGFNIGLIGVRTQLYTTALTQGIYFASQNGADALSMSWGGYSPSSSIESAINDAFNNYDVIAFAAAANDNVSTPVYPAYYSNVIAVAATNSNDQKASFSNYGTWVDISAPGTNIYSTVPFSQYTYMDGTSMACPITAGLATLVRCQFPSETNTQIRDRLYNSCDPMTGCSYYNSGYMGAGRINAQAALQGGGGPGGDTTELIYDDGTPTSGYYWSGAGAGSANRMTMPATRGTYRLLYAKIYLQTNNSGNNNFNLKVWNWTGSQPGSEAGSWTATGGVDNQWNLWNISSANIQYSSNTNFVVGMIYDGTNMPVYGYDYADNGRAWDYDAGWSSWDETYFMRAIVVNLSTGIEEEIGNDVSVSSLGFYSSSPVFSDNSLINFELPYESHTNISVFDMSGRLVRTLVDSHQMPGVKRISFDGRDETGSILPGGSYIVNLTTSKDSRSIRLVKIN